MGPEGDVTVEAVVVAAVVLHSIKCHKSTNCCSNAAAASAVPVKEVTESVVSVAGEIAVVVVDTVLWYSVGRSS